jgi:hypothetical protein
LGMIGIAYRFLSSVGLDRRRKGLANSSIVLSLAGLSHANP